MSEESYTEPVKEVRHIFQDIYETGKASNRFTIKYFTLEELKKKLEELKLLGLMDQE